MFISHNHYDHLDHNSIQALAARGVKKWFVPAGLGNWFKSQVRPSIDHADIIELSWWEEAPMGENSNLRVMYTPAMHWTTREHTLNPQHELISRDDAMKYPWKSSLRDCVCVTGMPAGLDLNKSLWGSWAVWEESESQQAAAASADGLGSEAVVRQAGQTSSHPDASRVGE